MAARKKGTQRTKARKPRSRKVKLTLDLDQLERLYRRTHRGRDDGDTKGSAATRRQPRKKR